MRKNSPLSVSQVSAIGLTLAIALILLASNFVIISAQQQQVTSQPGETNNGAFAPAIPPTTALRTFQSTNDSFRVQIPQYWRLEDVNNTGPAVLEETRLGYGMLAQLCPEQEIQPIFPNVNGSGGTSNCIASQNGVVHVIRYPDIETAIQPANNATTYHLQKLQEVGYRNMHIVNSTNMLVNLTLAQANQTIATLPAKFVEMTYTVASTPDEVRRGYFILTATNATSPNLGVTKGYSVFYEEISNSSNLGATTPGITRTTTSASTGSLSPVSLPLPVKQVFDSFELIVAPEVEQAIIQQQASVGQTGVGTTTTTTTTTGGGTGIDGACDFSYPDNCIPPPPPDLNCVDVGITNFRVLPPDPHDFDRDNDGVGCESGSGVPEDSAGGIDDDNGDDSCHPSYPDTCIPPPPPDLNCDDVSDTDFEVVGSDPHGFDGDNDGIGCENGDGGAIDDDGGDDDGGDDDGGDDDGGVNLDDCITVGGGPLDDCDFTPDDDDGDTGDGGGNEGGDGDGDGDGDTGDGGGNEGGDGDGDGDG